MENTTMIPPCTTLLSLQGNVLSDPYVDITEKGFALEILVGGTRPMVENGLA
jgi:hypothetical protein